MYSTRLPRKNRPVIKLRKSECAGMAELADAHGLGPCAERRAGSSPVPGTNYYLRAMTRYQGRIAQCVSPAICT